MRITGRNVLEVFCRKYVGARGWIEHWLADAETATWRTPADIRNSYATASFLPGGVVIFNVKGNSYRLEAVVAYQTGAVIVTWAGTHTAYDRRNRVRGRRN